MSRSLDIRYKHFDASGPAVFPPQLKHCCSYVSGFHLEIVCHTISHITRMIQPTFMLRILSHTHTRHMSSMMLRDWVDIWSWCWRFVSAGVRAHVSASVEVLQSWVLIWAAWRPSWQACRLLCVIAKVPISSCRGNSLKRAPLYFHTSLYTACGSRVQPPCSKCSKVALGTQE